VPNNLYGINDNFDLENGHVIPAIIRKIHDAKINKTTPVFWGNGTALREFTYAADISKILFYLLENYDSEEPINIGTTEERSIESVVTTICDVLGYNGNIVWDNSKPSGQARKPSSNKKLLEIGWKQENYTSFEDGIKMTCDWYLSNYPNVRGIK
jgi:GDP-L-fucose synthase